MHASTTDLRRSYQSGIPKALMPRSQWGSRRVVGQVLEGLPDRTSSRTAAGPAPDRPARRLGRAPERILLGTAGSDRPRPQWPGATPGRSAPPDLIKARRAAVPPGRRPPPASPRPSCSPATPPRPPQGMQPRAHLLSEDSLAEYNPYSRSCIAGQRLPVPAVGQRPGGSDRTRPLRRPYGAPDKQRSLEPGRFCSRTHLLRVIREAHSWAMAGVSRKQPFVGWSREPSGAIAEPDTLGNEKYPANAWSGLPDGRVIAQPNWSQPTGGPSSLVGPPQFSADAGLLTIEPDGRRLRDAGQGRTARGGGRRGGVRHRR